MVIELLSVCMCEYSTIIVLLHSCNLHTSHVVLNCTQPLRPYQQWKHSHSQINMFDKISMSFHHRKVHSSYQANLNVIHALCPSKVIANITTTTTKIKYLISNDYTKNKI